MKRKKIASLLIAFNLVFGFLMVETLFTKAMAENAATPAADSSDKPDPNLATDPSKCGYKQCEPKKRNCLFLEEPIGGQANFDLYLAHCDEGICTDGKFTAETGKGMVCSYSPWNGGSIPQNYSLKQALLTEDPNKPYQGPFGLLYSYIKLIYAYMSGLIVGVSVLFVVVSGIQMSMSGGDGEMFTKAKGRITKAIVGIIIWFTASLILYTINPTFFAF